MNGSNPKSSPFQMKTPLLRLLPWIGLAIFMLYIYHNAVRWDAIYYTYFAPFLLFNLNTIAKNWLEVVFLTVLVMNGTVIGFLLHKYLLGIKTTNIHYTESLALGWGILSLFTFGLALLQCLYTWFILLILLILTSISLLVALKFFLFYRCSPKICYSLLQDLSWPERIAFLFIAISVFYSFTSSLMPPTQSDGLRYHLTAPKWYLANHGFMLIPNLTFSNFPFLIEYLYLLPMALGLDSTAKGIHFIYFIITLLLVYRLANQYAGRTAGLFAAVLIATLPFSPIFSSWSFIEYGLTAYTVLAFSYALQFIESPKNENTFSLAILLGLAGGFLIGCKYTALASLAFFLFMVLLGKSGLQLDWKLYKSNFRYLLTAGIFAAIFGSVWYIKNWILFGNPLYPFLGSIFFTPGWSEFNSLFFKYHAGLKGSLTAAAQAPFWEQLIDFITLPFRITFFPGEPSHPESFGSWPMGSIWLFLGILILFHRRWERWFTWHIIFAFFLFGLWAFTYRDTRFLLPSLAIAAPALASSGIHFMHCIPEVRWLYLGKIFYVFMYTTGLLLLPYEYAPWWVVSGSVSDKEYLSQVNTFTRYECQAFFWLEENTQKQDIALLHGIDEPYYCSNQYIAADFFDTDPLLSWSWENPTHESLLKKIQKENVKYLVYNYGKIKQYGIFYRLFQLPPKKGYNLLEELMNHQYMYVYKPQQFQQWSRSFHLRLELAESNSPSVQALKTLLRGKGLQEVFRFDENPKDSTNVIVIYKIPAAIQ